MDPTSIPALHPGHGAGAQLHGASTGVERTLPALEARWARHHDEVCAAQRLRHEVFAGELGAVLRTPPGTPPGLDVDRFDAHCEHLLIVARAQGDAAEQVVGTYRVLTPAGARLAGGLYTETEFECEAPSAWERLRPNLAELGRSCTAPGWRHGGVIMMLWTHLVQFMARNRLTHMIGCASVPMHDGGHAAASLWHTLQATHPCRAGQGVRPRLALPLSQLRTDLAVEPPALVKGYLGCGARVLGAPAWDPEFGCADLPMMLDLDDLPSGYRRRFLGEGR